MTSSETMSVASSTSPANPQYVSWAAVTRRAICTRRTPSPALLRPVPRGGTMKQSIRVRPARERQGSAHAYAVLAQRRFRYGHPEASCESWRRSLDEYEHVSSVRGDDHFAGVRTDLAPYARTRATRELAGRVREVVAAKS
ncbi:hypothetical protein [Streptomyces sp. NTH33]|uniref:hypothetical protein n=1 Tax=Streptomyces sp. NTH33 TaxID=1735453 RepID=UPI0015E8EAB4|nr:hypothetical protein [Streptomyces sp. NTH33]